MRHHSPVHWNVLAVALALGTMLGCQGLSTGKSNTQDQGQQNPGVLTAAPTSLSFGNVEVGTSQVLVDTLTNTGESNLTVTDAAVTGAGLSTTGLNLPLILAAGQSATFSLVFSPQSLGSVSGNLALTNDGSSAPLNIAITGTAVAAGNLSGNPTSFSFGNVQVGASQSQTETLKNTGSESITISQATVVGTAFNYTGLSLPLTLAPNQSTTFGVVFAPTSAGAGSGSLSLAISGSSTVVDFALSGTGVTPAALSARPASITFSSIPVGQNQAQTETVTNTGGVNATISQAAASGTGFSLTGLSLPVTLTPGQSASFSVTFAPQSAGGFSGSVTISSNASNPSLSVALSGTATGQSEGQLSVSPATINVGNVTVGTSGTQTGTLNATGASVTVSSVSVGSAEFVITGLPVTIPAGQSANFSVTFTPQASGVASVSASFTSNASNSPTPATVTGTGVAPPVHTVNLSWAASTSPNIVGYNIYRRTGTTGSFTQINSALNATTTYVDTSVADGQTYYYETTAVNSSNEESEPSTPVSAVIPPP
jgi:Abnormal spindle-like microcephaly-assoc'd, ASPM-SPD-2-Hydin